MALIHCPECNKEISDKAASCPNCGFPIQEMNPKSPSSSINIKICPRCGRIFGEDDIKCICSAVNLKKTHISYDDYKKMDIAKQWEIKQELYKKYVIDSFEFDKVLFDKVYNEGKNAYYSYKIAHSQPKITCPYCHSTNTYRISSMAKAANIAMFGIFGNKRKYQWHCNNCNSDF